jgi:NADH:flavin oxidoreductase / NADH oxidase family
MTPPRSSSKIFLVAINTGYATDGEPDRRMIDFYAMRCSPSLYCAIVGNVVIPNGYPSNGSSATITRSKNWHQLARAISDRGSVPGIQLATAWDGYSGNRSFLSKLTAEAIMTARNIALTYSAGDISRVFMHLQEGTEIAIAAGFRHIQLHAAHGYLFSLLIDPRIFPGAVEIQSKIADWLNRTRLMGAETSIRISLRTGDAEFDSYGMPTFHSQMVSLPAQYMDISSGFYNIDKRLIYPARAEVLDERHRDTLLLAQKHPSTQFILSGRAMKLRMSVPSNVHFGLGRDLLANPRFLFEQHKGCLNTGKCHFHSRGATHITCGQWSADNTRR